MFPQPVVAAGASVGASNEPRVKVTYQVVDFRTISLESFPEPANSFDRLDISSDAAEVAALDGRLVAKLGTNTAALSSQPVSAGSTSTVSAGIFGNQIPVAVTSPQIRCAANLYFRGLEASLLCEYDGATSTASNFRMVNGNDAWQRSNIEKFEIGHAVSWPLRDGPMEDGNGRKFLGVYFRIGSGGHLTELLGKKIGQNRKETVLTDSERRGLNLKCWGELPEY